jgi:hypothetical protein
LISSLSTHQLLLNIFLSHYFDPTLALASSDATAIHLTHQFPRERDRGSHCCDWISSSSSSLSSLSSSFITPIVCFPFRSPFPGDDARTPKADGPSQGGYVSLGRGEPLALFFEEELGHRQSHVHQLMIYSGECLQSSHSVSALDQVAS